MRLTIALCILVASFTQSVTARGAAIDERAAVEGEHAMNDLFAAAKFDEAKSTLLTALGACAGCSSATKAELRMDLAIVYVTAFHDSAKGAAQFVKARKLDPKIALDPAFTTPDVQAAFDAGAPKGSATAEAVVLDEEPEEDAAPKKPPQQVTEPPASEPSCTADADCEHREVCVGGRCEAPSATPRAPTAWLTLGVIQDFLVASGNDVCTEKSQVSGGFTCLRASGTQYHGTPLLGAGGSLSALTFATTRVALASYFPLWDHLSAGLRIAYAVAGRGPQADGGPRFIPFQAEIQGAYWFSPRAFPTDQVAAPFLELSGGVAEIDGSVKVPVKENTQASPPPNQLDNPPSQSLEAYQKSGSGFLGVGAGLFLPFAPIAGLLADLRASALFPSSGFALSLGISGALGL